MSKATAIAIDINGNKWFVPWLGNICEFDGTEWTNFGLSNLASIYVMDIAIDSDGNKWFGTDSGVSMLVDSSITNVEDGKEIIVHSSYDFSICTSGGDLFINYLHKTSGKVVFLLFPQVPQERNIQQLLMV